jgi:hypothetical protein
VGSSANLALCILAKTEGVLLIGGDGGDGDVLECHAGGGVKTGVLGSDDSGAGASSTDRDSGSDDSVSGDSLKVGDSDSDSSRNDDYESNTFAILLFRTGLASSSLTFLLGGGTLDLLTTLTFSKGSQYLDLSDLVEIW